MAFRAASTERFLRGGWDPGCTPFLFFTVIIHGRMKSAIFYSDLLGNFHLY